MTAMASTAAATCNNRKKSSPSSSLLFFKWGCTDARSVSVSAVHSKRTADEHVSSVCGRRHSSSALSSGPETSSADTITLSATTGATTSSTFYDDGDEDDSPSFSGLLRQLNELEQSVASWDCRRRVSSEWPAETFGTGEERGKPRKGGAAQGENSQTRKPRQERQRRCHRRSVSEGSDLGLHETTKVGESVAVVKESDDPLGDFRRSMLQMIVEKEIVGGDDLRELLRRFLMLNPPSHHPVIIRAFADIWRDVFSGYGNLEDDPILLLLHPPLAVQRRPDPQPRLRRNSYHAATGTSNN